MSNSTFPNSSGKQFTPRLSAEREIVQPEVSNRIPGYSEGPPEGTTLIEENGDQVDNLHETEYWLTYAGQFCMCHFFGLSR